MEGKVVLMIFCGCPCTGKTYFATKFKDHMNVNNRNINFIKISFDKIINSKLEKVLIENDTWKQSRSLVQSLIKALISYLKSTRKMSFIEYLNQQKSTLEILEEIYSNFTNEVSPQLESSEKQRYVICLDDNMYYESMRLKYYQLAREESCSYYCVCFKVKNLEKLLKLNHDRVSDEFRITDTIIENMFTKFDFPNLVKWEKECCLVLEFDEIDFTKLFSDLVELLDRLLVACNTDLAHSEEVFTRNYDTNLNIKHQSDLILRRLVKETIERGCDANRKEVAKKCNKAKSDILSKLSAKSDDLYVKLNDLFNENLFVYENYLQNQFLNKI